MKQSRSMSLVESSANIAIGYGISVLSQAIILPMFDLHPTMKENLLISGAFTAVSLVRSYVLRRLFNAIG